MLESLYELHMRINLGTDLGKGIDLLCSMIKSAVTANHSKSLSMVPFFIPLVANDRVFLTNLITVLVDRTSTSNTNGLSDTQRMARAALDQSKIKHVWPLNILSTYVLLIFITAYLK